MITIKDYKDEILETVLEKTYYCFVFVDAKGLITFLNDNYCRFLEVEKKYVIGKHVILEKTKKRAIEAALKKADYNKIKIAKILDLGKSSFYEKQNMVCNLFHVSGTVPETWNYFI